MNVNFIPPPRQETLGANVLSQIRELLLTGQVMPGEQLSLRSTAQALGVSMTPVREAVYQLVADQALEVTPNRSVRVPVLSAAQFREVTALRLQIEGYAVEQAVPHACPALLERLRGLNRTLADAMLRPDGDKADLVTLNKELHFAIYDAARMPMLTKIIESLWLRIGPILNYDLRNGSERTTQQIAVAYHDAMILGLEQGDPARVRQALHEDIGSTFEYILQKHYPASGSFILTASPPDGA